MSIDRSRMRKAIVTSIRGMLQNNNLGMGMTITEATWEEYFGTELPSDEVDARAYEVFQTIYNGIVAELLRALEAGSPRKESNGNEDSDS